ncbi:MAG: replication endonuclease [Gammaproteobacteria bacterium]|nr:replication endonuclease [Gammaproteobacteria bacterium]
MCRGFWRQSRDLVHAYSMQIAYAAEKGISPPLPDRNRVLRSLVRRLACEKWWRRALRATRAQLVEGHAIRLGLVHAHKQIYASDETVYRCRQQNAHNRDLLASMEAVNELDQCYTLEELAELSTSNPKIRRAELMARMAGFELLADSLRHIAEFYTLTAPGRMHRYRFCSGTGTGPARLKPVCNRNHDGSNPRDANRYLCRVWARIRAKLKRQGIPIYGFRVAEPHHDATPHWHLLLFMASEHREAVRGILRHYALQDSPDEPGAQEHRFKAVEIDRRKGTATGYIAKYISKNIDGAHLDHGVYGEDPVKGAERVNAWAKTWGIRQFQQIGGPPVGIWRELRRIPRTKQDQESDKDPSLLDRARDAADQGDWAKFVLLMGGPDALRKHHPISLAKLHSDAEGFYGDPVGESVFGVSFKSETFETRPHTWTIRSRAQVQLKESPFKRGCTQQFETGLFKERPLPLEFCQ